MKSNSCWRLSDIFIVGDFQVDCRYRKVKVFLLGDKLGNNKIAVLRLRQDGDFIPFHHDVRLFLGEVYIDFMLMIVVLVQIRQSLFVEPAYCIHVDVDSVAGISKL